MDRRHIELQIRAVVVTHRIEQRRRDAPTMEAFRARGRSILERLDAEVEGHPDLAARLLEARQELAEAARAASGAREPRTSGK